jgi:hypothetical protein
LRGIEIKDSVPRERGNYLSFDLKDILGLIGERALVSQWRCRWVECTGENAREMHSLSDVDRNISGAEILRLASGISQTIDGQFEAFAAGESNPWLLIKAIDSSLFEVWSHDPDILLRVKTNFSNVSDLPTDAA